MQLDRDERDPDYPGYEGCDRNLIEQLLQRRQEGVTYLKDLERQITEARLDGMNDDSTLCRARRSTVSKITAINKELREERLRVERGRQAELLQQRDLVRNLSLFQCLRKASAILSHRNGEAEQALRLAIETYLKANRKEGDDHA